MPVDIYEYRGMISTIDLGRYFKDRTGKASLRTLVRGWISRIQQTAPLPTPNLQRYVDRYSEQVVADPVADINKYLRTSHARGFTAGGVGTGLAPLAIVPRDLRPSNSAISALAEGLAGWYLETAKNMIPLARPIGEGPDLIFTDPRTASDALVQVKGTQEPDLQGRLLDGALDLLDYASRIKLMAPNARYPCYIVGVIIKTGSDYELRNLQIDLV